MKKLLALLVVGGMLALTTGCPPGTTSAPTPPPPPVGSSEKVTSGKITKIDKDKNQIVVTADGKDNTFDVKDAKIMVGSDAKSLSDLKTDMTATVTADKDGKVTKVDAK